MKYCAAYYSDIGIQKETNQDSLLLVQRGQTQDDEAVLAVICDGVGGLKMGERSSAAVVTAFRDWFDERVEELYEQEEPETELFDDWDNLIQSLHIRLKDNSEKAGFRSGTTVEAVLFMKGRYYMKTRKRSWTTGTATIRVGMPRRIWSMTAMPQPCRQRTTR